MKLGVEIRSVDMRAEYFSCEPENRRRFSLQGTVVCRQQKRIKLSAPKIGASERSLTRLAR